LKVHDRADIQVNYSRCRSSNGKRRMFPGR